MKQRFLSTLVFICMVFGITACTSTVEPWERENFAKNEMQWEPDPMQAAFNRHVYSSKEATSGGTTTAGGGCSCN